MHWEALQENWREAEAVSLAMRGVGVSPRWRIRSMLTCKKFAAFIGKPFKDAALWLRSARAEDEQNEEPALNRMRKRPSHGRAPAEPEAELFQVTREEIPRPSDPPAGKWLGPRFSSPGSPSPVYQMANFAIWPTRSRRSWAAARAICSTQRQSICRRRRGLENLVSGLPTERALSDYEKPVARLFTEDKEAFSELVEDCHNNPQELFAFVALQHVHAQAARKFISLLIDHVHDLERQLVGSSR